MIMLPAEIYERILSCLPFINLLRLRRVSRLWNRIIFHLLSHTKCNPYLSSWTMVMTTSSGKSIPIPLNLDRTRDATDWADIYRRPYIFSGPISGVYQREHPQVLKFQFWDEKQGEYSPPTNPECRYRCCGLCDTTIWPWSTLPMSRQGPLGEVIQWRDLFKIDLWESHWDDALIRQRSIEQHIGAPWNHDNNPIDPQIVPPPILPMNQPENQGPIMNFFGGQPIQMNNDGSVTSFSPNRIRIALSYSAICGFLLVHRRKQRAHYRRVFLDPVSSVVQDPKMRELAVQSIIGCGCKLVDWEHEDLGIKIIRLDDSECNSYDRFR